MVQANLPEFRTQAVRTVRALLLLLPLCLLASPASAEGWLEKAANLFKAASGNDAGKALSKDQIGSALKEALRVGTGNVVKQLGAVDGFNADPKIHIPLPDGFVKAKALLAKAGLAPLMDDLELKLNRAAEKATPKAKTVLWGAINDMSFVDAMKIYKGPQDAATRYFEKTMTPELAVQMTPIVTDSLAQVGAIKVYDKLLAKYNTLPFLPDLKSHLTNYVVEAGMSGIFHYVAVEEAAIRADPKKRTTQLLKKAFGNQQ